MDDSLLLPRLVQKWARDILGARGYMRALNGGPDRRVLQEIALCVEEGARDHNELNAIFAGVATRRGSLGEVLAELRRPAREPMRTPVAAGVARQASGSGPLAPGAAQRAAASAPSSSARTAAGPGASASSETTAAAVRTLEHELGRVRFELSQFRRTAEELETLARELAARAVEDATRIQALESVVLAIADGSGIGDDARRIHATATARYLARFDPR